MFPVNRPKEIVRQTILPPSSMTICLAAFTPDKDFLVTASDTRLSWPSGLFFDHAKTKFSGIARGWEALYAGGSGKIKFVYDGLIAALGKKKGATSDEVRLAAYRVAERERKGKPLGIEMILAGFDKQTGSPCMFYLLDTVGSPLDIQTVQADYVAIGAGAEIAAIILNRMLDDPNLGFGGLIYRLCEAKFWAEQNNTVSPKTYVHVISAKHAEKMIKPEGVERIRAWWRTKGLSPVPKGTVDLIESVWETTQERDYKKRPLWIKPQPKRRKSK